MTSAMPPNEPDEQVETPDEPSRGDQDTGIGDGSSDLGPGERPRAVFATGITADEERAGANLEERLSAEEPDVGEPAGRHSGASLDADEHTSLNAESAAMHIADDSEIF